MLAARPVFSSGVLFLFPPAGTDALPLRQVVQMDHPVGRGTGQPRTGRTHVDRRGSSGRSKVQRGASAESAQEYPNTAFTERTTSVYAWPSSRRNASSGRSPPAAANGFPSGLVRRRVPAIHFPLGVVRHQQLAVGRERYGVKRHRVDEGLSRRRPAGDLPNQDAAAGTRRRQPLTVVTKGQGRDLATVSERGCQRPAVAEVPHPHRARASPRRRGQERLRRVHRERDHLRVVRQHGFQLAAPARQQAQRRPACRRARSAARSACSRRTKPSSVSEFSHCLAPARSKAAERFCCDSRRFPSTAATPIATPAWRPPARERRRPSARRPADCVSSSGSPARRPPPDGPGSARRAASGPGRPPTPRPSRTAAPVPSAGTSGRSCPGSGRCRD